MSELEELQTELKEFIDERDWKKFHNPKDLSISIVLEASEVLEHFQWKTPEQIDNYLREHKEHVAEEMADVFKYLLNLADVLDVDIVAAAKKKLEKDKSKHSVDKIYGKAPSVY
jgi:NTP pyrophosphatase (non-canonical NTP hydrolase)